MPRIRTIKPDFCTSPSTRRLSRDARLFFLQLLTEADDEGRFVASAKLLAGSLYPHDDDVTGARINKWLIELEKVDMVTVYEVDDVRYGAFVNWSKHQKISHPTDSRLPPPPLRNISGDDPEPFGNGAGVGRESFRPDLGKGKGKGSSSSSESAVARRNSGIEEEEIELRKEAERRFTLRPPTAKEVVDVDSWMRTTIASIREERAKARSAQLDNARLWGVTLARTGHRGRYLVDVVRERYGRERDMRLATLRSARETRRKLVAA